MTFVDTSALYALADAGDPNHHTARKVFAQLLDDRVGLVTHNYVVLETVALVQRRLGIQPALRIGAEVNRFRVVWIDRPRHDDALAALAHAQSRGISLVDHASFRLMRELSIERAFAFDADFAAAGFVLLP